jgi:hypothetical protein
MTFTDYLLNGVLVALVLVQIRGRRLSTSMLLRPILIVGVVAATYLRAIPTEGHDVALALVGAAVGTALGTCCGLATSVFRNNEGHVIVKAGFLAALLWVAGVGSRLAFSLYSEHGGGPAVTRFSIANHITSTQAWIACLVLMAIMEVVSRTAVLAWRRNGLESPMAVIETPQAVPARSIMGLDGHRS